MRKLIFTTLILVLAGVVALACTSIIVGKDASVDGSVMVTHTCDGSYDSRVQVIPGQTFPEGAMAPVYEDRLHETLPGHQRVKRGEIPQVSQTYTYFHVAYPFMNEHQVLIGEATFGGRSEMVNDEGLFFIEELEAFALQRAKTAREAIKIMGELAEKYGYADWGETLTVIDPNEAWVFEIVGPGPLWTPDCGEPGAVWVAQRVPDDHVFVVANRSRIGEIDLSNPDYFMASPNVFSKAEELGFWKPEDGPFVFHKVYNPNPYGWPHYQRRREWRVFSLLAPSLNLDPYADFYPFSVKPDKKVSVRDLMAIKRDHYEGTEFDLTKGMAAGPFGNPNRYATPRSVRPEGKENLDWERAISIFRCSYSFVGQARSWLPDPIGGVIWFGEDAPHSTVYVPFYAGITHTPKSFSEGSREFFDKDYAWWAFNFVSNWADLKYCYMIEDIKKVQKEFEDQFFANQPAIEKTALGLYNEDPELAIQFLTTYSNTVATTVVDRWWKLADELVFKYYDGYVGGKSVGYPTWWLEEVGFGDTVTKK